MNTLTLVARSLIICAFFLLPLLALLLLHKPSRPQRLRKAPGAALAVAVVSALAFLGIIFFSKHWPEGTQVAWTGVEASGRALSIGGAREGAVVGWPNGSFAPLLKSISVEDKRALLEVTEGSAFVYDEARESFRNGEVLERDKAVSLAGYQVRARREWRASLRRMFRADVVDILTEQGELVAQFDLPAPNQTRHSVLSLRTLLESKGASTVQDAELLVMVGKWAADKRLLVTRSGEARVLGTEPYRVDCELPCKLSLHWIGQRLPLVLWGNESKLSVMFSPPWRLSCPVPPASSGAPKLTLTAIPRPDDVAFVIPLGHAVRDMRPVLTLSEDDAGRPVFKGDGVTLGSAPPPDYLPAGVEVAPDPAEVGESVTSRVAVGFDQTTFHFATVNDLPQPFGIGLILLVAFVSLVAGFKLSGARSPDQTTVWLVYCLAACLWDFLLLRLLLSIRFALNPNFLDRLTVKGVTLAAVSLAVLPGLFLLWMRLKADLNARLKESADAERAIGDEEAVSNEEHWRGMRKQVLVHLLIMLAAFFVELWLAGRLWRNSPGSSGWLLPLVFVALLLYLFLVVNSVYLRGIDELRRVWRFLFVAPLRFDASLARSGKNKWLEFAEDSHDGSGRWLRLYIAASVVFILLPLLLRIFPGYLREIIQEVAALLAFALVPALFWLSLTLVRKRMHVGWRRLLVVVIPLAFLPVFFVPKFIGDTGTVFATIPLFLIVAAVLWYTHAWRAGLSVALAVCIGLLVTSFTYAYFSSLLPGASEVRLLAYWQGAEVERYLPWARATKTGDGLSLQSLREAYQHTWENRAIAHEGSWWGMGYGNAPTRSSQVRQDTIQFDSLFSFFVASEHGLPGALATLACFAVPLLLVGYGAWRSRLDFGYAGAAIIFSWLFLEAILHAGMTLGTFPFTGRGMPLVNVNSTSDMLRWTVLFCLAGQFLFWRDPSGNEHTAEDTASITRRWVLPTARNVAPNAPARRTLIMTATALALVPLLIVGVSHARLLTDARFQRTFEWSGLLDRVDKMIGDGVLEIDQNSKTIKPDWGKKLPAGFDVPHGALLEQEILRFNAMPLEERLDNQTSAEYRKQLQGVSQLSDYDRLVESLRVEELLRRRDSRPNLFLLLPPERQTDGITVQEVSGYRLATNPAVNVHLSFRAGVKREEIPRVAFSDGQVLIGPAWVGGRWVAAYDFGHSVPWVAQMARSLTQDQNCFGRDENSPCEVTLALNRNLHEAATRFVSVKGRRLYEEMLRLGVRPVGHATALPPRVALAIVNLPKGETLALGGYPRMTSSPYWQRASASGEWLPPAHWVEHQAPEELRVIYGGDRNFDRLIVGSATKPMIAAAVLQVHPQLSEQLWVGGSTSSESDVFGIPLSRSWLVTPRARCVDFDQYLALSDNRYHVRLGFLGLTDDNGGAVRTVGNSPSVAESLSKDCRPWGKYPQFGAQLGFSYNNPHTIDNLERTPFADHLERMFSIRSGNSSGSSARVSFWTKNEGDDFAAGELPRFENGQQVKLSGRPVRGFKTISPAAPNFRLDSINAPNDYVMLLLGGRTNLWSNLDLASAFVSSFTGKPFAAAAIKDDRPFNFLPNRENFPDTAARLRRALEMVAGTTGTVGRELAGTEAAPLLRSYAGYHIYAKTGTLQMTQRQKDNEAARYMSRVVLAIVRWDNDSKPQEIRSGLVFSIVGEMAEEGAAVRWLGEFLVENQKEIKQFLR
jgi:hypothetical protein